MSTPFHKQPGGVGYPIFNGGGICRAAVIGTLSLILHWVLPLAPAHARTWHVPQEAPTIQAGIDSARAGDDVLVAPGQYFEHDILMRAGIWVHSEQGPDATTVDAEGRGGGFTGSDLGQNTMLQGFTILNGQQVDGGGVSCVNSVMWIYDCIIRGCTAGDLGGGIGAKDAQIVILSCTVDNCSAYAGGGIGAYQGIASIADCHVTMNEASVAGGIYATGPEVTIERCRVSGNSASSGIGGGLALWSTGLTVRDCLVTDNHIGDLGFGDGIAIFQSSGLVSGCTVANNTGAPGERCGMALVETSDLRIERTIIAFNMGPAFCCQGQVNVSCCDLYGNTGGNGICGEDLDGNFSADPLFCDAENGDYSLDAQSPCLPGNHPGGVDCGLIGALGQGCGATPVQGTTWGRIKAGYR